MSAIPPGRRDNCSPLEVLTFTIEPSFTRWLFFAHRQGCMRGNLHGRVPVPVKQTTLDWSKAPCSWLVHRSFPHTAGSRVLRWSSSEVAARWFPCRCAMMAIVPLTREMPSIVPGLSCRNLRHRTRATPREATSVPCKALEVPGMRERWKSSLTRGWKIRFQQAIRCRLQRRPFRPGKFAGTDFMSIPSAQQLAYLRLVPSGTAQASPPAKRRERVRNRFSRPLSSENMPPRPGTTSMISCVCFHASNWPALM